MNGACTAVEWVFGDIINYFKFLDFKNESQYWLKCNGENVHRLCLDSECSYYFVPVY